MSICTLEDGDAYLGKYINKNWPGVYKAELRKNKTIMNELREDLRTNINLSIVKIASFLRVNRGMVERQRPQILI